MTASLSSGSSAGRYALVFGLGITCTIGYATVLYSFSLLSIEIEKAFNWTNEFIFGVYSLGVFLTGLVATYVGRLIDRQGARLPMCMGSILVSLSFFGLSIMDSKVEFVFFMLTLEVVSILVIYESAFVALTQSMGQEARKAISQITLIAGFASTIAWPLISELLKYTDWRGVYVCMALLHICVCLPIHWLVVKPIVSHKYRHKPDSQVTHDIGVGRDRVTEVLIAVALGLAAFTVVGLQIHLFVIFDHLHVSERIAIIAGALIGPFQVISRLTDMFLTRYITAYHVGLISISAMTIGLMFLIATQAITPLSALLFAIFFGIGQGLTNIVRGALPLQFFGVSGYGKITGRMNKYRLFLTALAPISFAYVIDRVGVLALIICLIAVCIVSAGLLRIATQRYCQR